MPKIKNAIIVSVGDLIEKEGEKDKRVVVLKTPLLSKRNFIVERGHISRFDVLKMFEHPYGKIGDSMDVEFNHKKNTDTIWSIWNYKHKPNEE